jgi:hypothetical protein
MCSNAPATPLCYLLYISFTLPSNCINVLTVCIHFQTFYACSRSIETHNKGIARTANIFSLNVQIMFQKQISFDASHFVTVTITALLQWA